MHCHNTCTFALLHETCSFRDSSATDRYVYVSDDEANLALCIIYERCSSSLSVHSDHTKDSVYEVQNVLYN